MANRVGWGGDGKRDSHCTNKFYEMKIFIFGKFTHPYVPISFFFSFVWYIFKALFGFILRQSPLMVPSFIIESLMLLSCKHSNWLKAWRTWDESHEYAIVASSRSVHRRRYHRYLCLKVVHTGSSANALRIHCISYSEQLGFICCDARQRQSRHRFFVFVCQLQTPTSFAQTP